MKLLNTILLIFISSLLLHSQSIGWKAYYNQAEELFEQGKYYQAGENYHSAWEAKKSRAYILKKAGNAYYQANAFMEASEAFKILKADHKKFPLAGLKYARSLKQTGNYDAAIQEFMNFINKYEDDEKEFLSIIVQNEIKGCELGKRLKAEQHTQTTSLKLLNPQVNTSYNESAPLPISDELLFFTSDIEETNKFFRSLYERGKWANVTISDDFPEIHRKTIGSGTLTTDGKTFYFTRCQIIDGPNGLKQETCSIFASRNEGGAWTTPIKLNRKINADGATASHPGVIHMDGFEVLFFSSNRSGGQGGMDIWFAMRDLDSDDLNFDYPINLGSPVNTVGDEITPFYDANEKTLYFSSNGHINIGGYDIFKSIGTPEKWALPTNMGVPFNSPNNDIFFTKEPERNNGFFASNRLFDFKRSNTYDLDLFAFQIPEANYSLSGKIYDTDAVSLLKDVWITIYEIVDEDKPLKVLHSTIFHNGEYLFSLVPGKHYIMDIKKEGYTPASFDFIPEFSRKSVAKEKIFYLKRYEAEPNENLLATTNHQLLQDKNDFNLGEFDKGLSGVDVPNQPENNPIPEDDHPEIFSQKGPIKEKTSMPKDYNNQPENKPLLRESSTPTKIEKENKDDLLTYKVQIIALETPNVNKPRYERVKAYGDLFTEKIPNQRLYRVLVGEYTTIEAAQNIVDQLKNDGVFNSPLIVEYENGVRGDFID